MQVSPNGTIVNRLDDVRLAHELAIIVEVNKAQVGYWKAQADDARARAAALTALATGYDRAVEHASRSDEKLAAFKEQVREVAIKVAEEQHWCRGGLNETLEELGLPAKEDRYIVELVVKVVVTGELDDEYDAKEQAREFVQENLRCDTSDENAVESIEVVDVNEYDED